MGSKSQITIFVIIALLIAGVILVLAFFSRKPEVSVSPSTDPEAYIKKCARDSAKKAIDILSERGGDINPEGSVMYNGKNITYLCYNANFYTPCINQRPMLIEHIEEQITDYSSSEIETCFSDLKEELEKRGSVINVNEIKVDASLVLNSIIININAPTVIRKESATSFNKLKVDVKSELYSLVMLASSISNYGARYGDSDSLTYMLYYPDIKVEKIEVEESRIYILTYKPTGEKLIFAEKSIPWPAGYLGRK